MKSILLVEDDPLIAEIYTTKLKEEGFEVELSEHGEEALSKLKKRSFDLLILDVVLPNISGFELLEKIKKDRELKDLKTLILSNLGEKSDIERGLKLGAEKYLIKAHFTPSGIVKEIKEMLTN